MTRIVVADGGQRGAVGTGAGIDPAHAVNEVIRECAAAAPDEFGDDLWDFVCECGCFRIVRLTLAAFDAAGGAWLQGHRSEPC